VTSDWARETTRRVAAEIKRLRGDKRKVQWLSDRTADLGHRISRSRISDLERGDRGGLLGVAELLVLAKALEVPPLQLLFPIGREAKVEVLPGTVTPTWAAAKWFTGEAPLGTRPNTDDMHAWKAGVPLLFRKLDERYDRWADARREVQEAREAAAEAPAEEREKRIRDLELSEEVLRRVEDDIRQRREHIRARGLDPGELFPEFSYIDDASRSRADVP
jgi:transcriptional regulator with XRE-family HTH domain